MHLAAQDAARLGNHAAVRRQVRDLCLVRRLLGLFERAARYERRVVKCDPAGDRALHRQGHPQDARDLLARDAAVGWLAALSASECARLSEIWRRADV